MGNQTSRPNRNSTTTINGDPCLDNMRQWHMNKNDEPYKRQYPLPTIASDHNRIKPRKQSSPAAVNSNNRPRKPFSRLFNKNNKSLLRNNSCFDPALINNTLTPKQVTYNNNTNTSNNNDTLNTPNAINTNDTSASSSSNSQPHYIHPLAPPSIISMDQSQLFPFENESFSKPSKDTRKLDTNNSQIKLFMQQQQQQFSSYRVKDKRKYHKVDNSNYLLPCDDEEVDRLHLQHFMIRFAIQGNYLAPVSDVLRKGARVLDIGCGPGSWSMEIAGEYPRSTVTGIDMTPIYPREIKPSNCAFYQCNILNPLPFEDCTFDYIFMRFMGQGIDADKWPFVLSELIRVLKPNGWIEWVEADIEIHRPGPVTLEFNQKLMNLMSENNQDPNIGRTLKERLTETNALTQITSMYVSCPGGQWAGKLGQLTMQTWKAYYQALRPLMCEDWGISHLEYNERLKICWGEADKYKTFENVHFSYAQKRSIPDSTASLAKQAQ